MKNIKTSILKASLIALGLQPIISNAQWTNANPPVQSGNAIITGNLGIGTASTGDKLQVDPNGVVGGITIGSGSDSRTALTLAVSALSGGYSIINSVKSQGHFYGDLVLNQTAGNVGIGMSPDPTYKLDVNGSIRSKFIGVANTSGTVYLGWSQLASVTYASPSTVWFHTYNDNAGNLKISSGQNPTDYPAIMTINSSGNVGIGITIPQAKLHVVGNSKLDGDISSKSLTTSNTNGTVVVGSGYQSAISFLPSSGYYFHIDNNGTDLKISTGATINQYPQMVINAATGNVGIGTTTPRVKLDVNGQVVIGTRKTTASDYQLSVDGKIYCTELNVTPGLPATGNSNWADYVFKSDYKLASLTEVEKYIKENGHLEHVPSAEQVAKTGYKVGEMDATLLRKVEELTLYLLEQKKSILEQNKKLQLQDQKIKELESKIKL